MKSFIIAGAIGYGAYCIYNKYLKKSQDLPVKYAFSIHDDYDIKNPARVYKYEIDTPTFNNFEKVYKMDLFGNYKKKEHIDKSLKHYLETHKICERRVVFDMEGYVGDFTIKEFTSPKTLVIIILNDSVYEVKLDGKNES